MYEKLSEQVEALYEQAFEDSERTGLSKEAIQKKHSLLIKICDDLNYLKETAKRPNRLISYNNICIEILRLPAQPEARGNIMRMIESRRPIMKPAEVFTYAIAANSKLMLENKLLESREEFHINLRQAAYENIALLFTGLHTLTHHIQIPSLDKILEDWERALGTHYEELNEKFRRNLQQSLRDGGILNKDKLKDTITRIQQICKRLVSFLPVNLQNNATFESLTNFVSTQGAEQLKKDTEEQGLALSFQVIAARLNKAQLLAEVGPEVDMPSLAKLYEEVKGVLSMLIDQLNNCIVKELKEANFFDVVNRLEQLKQASQLELQVHLPRDRPTTLEYDYNKNIEKVKTKLSESLVNLTNFFKNLTGMPTKEQLEMQREAWILVKNASIAPGLDNLLDLNIEQEYYKPLKDYLSKFISDVVENGSRIQTPYHKTGEFLEKLSVLQKFDQDVSPLVLQCKNSLLKKVESKLENCSKGFRAMLRLLEAGKLEIQREKKGITVINDTRLIKSLEKFTDLSYFDPYFFEPPSEEFFAIALRNYINSLLFLKQTVVEEFNQENYVQADMFLRAINVLLVAQDVNWPRKPMEGQAANASLLLLDQRSKELKFHKENIKVELDREFKEILSRFKEKPKDAIKKGRWRELEAQLSLLEVFLKTAFTQKECKDRKVIITEAITSFKIDVSKAIETELLSKETISWYEVDRLLAKLRNLEKYPKLNSLSEVDLLKEKQEEVERSIQSFLSPLHEKLKNTALSDFGAESLSALRQLQRLESSPNISSIQIFSKQATDLETEYQNQCSRIAAKFGDLLATDKYSLIEKSILSPLKNMKDAPSQQEFNQKIWEVQAHLNRKRSELHSQIHSMFSQSRSDLEVLSKLWHSFEQTACLDPYIPNGKPSIDIAQLKEAAQTKIKEEFETLKQRLTDHSYKEAQVIYNLLSNHSLLLSDIYPPFTTQKKESEELIKTQLTKVVPQLFDDAAIDFRKQQQILKQLVEAKIDSPCENDFTRAAQTLVSTVRNNLSVNSNEIESLIQQAKFTEVRSMIGRLRNQLVELDTSLLGSPVVNIQELEKKLADAMQKYVAHRFNSDLNSPQDFAEFANFLANHELPNEVKEEPVLRFRHQYNQTLELIKEQLANKFYKVLNIPLNWLRDLSRSELTKAALFDSFSFRISKDDITKHYISALQLIKQDAERIKTDLFDFFKKQFQRHLDPSSGTPSSILENKARVFLELKNLESHDFGYHALEESLGEFLKVQLGHIESSVTYHVEILSSGKLPNNYNCTELFQLLSGWRSSLQCLETIRSLLQGFSYPSYESQTDKIKQALETIFKGFQHELFEEVNFGLVGDRLLIVCEIHRVFGREGWWGLDEKLNNAISELNKRLENLRTDCKHHWDDSNLVAFARSLKQLQQAQICNSLSRVPGVKLGKETEGIVFYASKRIAEEKNSILKEKDPISIADRIILLKGYSDVVPQLVQPIFNSIKDVLNHNFTVEGMTHMNKIGMFLRDQGRLGREVLDDFPQFASLAAAEFTKRTAHLNIDYALEHLSGDNINKEKLREAYNLFDTCYKSCLNRYIVDIKQFDLKKVTPDLVREIKKIVSCLPQNVTDDWKDTKVKEHMPSLIAHVFALWTLVNSGELYHEVKDTKYLLSPHCIQVLSIFRLLNVDSVDKVWLIFSSNQLSNHLIEIGTGEGKSVTLGMLSIVLALLGYHTSCVCYSQYLSSRDYNAFKELFVLLEIENCVGYWTFEQLCDNLINEKADIRELTKRLITSSPLSLAAQRSIVPLEKRILLIDEVDVFFSETFYGVTYNPATNIISEKITALVKFLWAHRNEPQLVSWSNIQKNALYTQMVNEFPNCQALFSLAAKAMTSDLPHFATPQYEVDSVNDRIGYKKYDDVSYNTSFGYRTMFAYLKENAEKNITDEALKKQVAVSLICGLFSFASIPFRFCKILGVTGTLKNLSPYERTIVENEYGIKRKTFTPSVFGQRNCEFAEVAHVKVEDDIDTWGRAIREDIDKEVAKKRAVLVFFDTEDTVNNFIQSSYGKSFDKLNTIVETTLDKEFYIKKASTFKQVTFLSRMFGRGVDFICRDEVVINAGGVHVIQTFLSESYSEEVQIMGRTARQGQKGSFRLIVKVPDLEKMGVTKEEITEQRKDTKMYQFLHKKRLDYADQKSKERTKVVEKTKEKHKTSQEYLKLLHYSSLSKDQHGQAIKFLTDFQSAFNTIKIGNQKLMHTLLLIDISGSMGAKDAQPSDMQRELKKRLPNRLGAVLEALSTYITQRVAANPEDLITIIPFSHEAPKPLVGPIRVKDLDIWKVTANLVPTGGTDFDPPLLQAEKVLNTYKPVHHIPFVFFLSDGGGNCTKGYSIVQRLKANNPHFRLDTLIFGNDTSGEQVLQKLATLGGGNLLKTAASLEELEEVMGFLDKNF
eukprot:TRINITY_DN7477_c0_g1_i1.p1 TRINITY_DN7477_c0_g1~~TRINITY_DN7477_c0_g1_i1.p1  ORF type:complete len:2625 (-),score=455.21 TRINITY_DN7477_c0_g1_i1:64-7305(-)